MNNYQCAVIVPVYRSLTGREIQFVRQGKMMTSGFEKVFVAPHSLVFDDTFKEFPDYRIFRFDDGFFQSLQTYNQLMLSVEFYETFAAYRYILMLQPDAWLFKSELNYWCGKNYDYIGAPWANPEGKKHGWWYRLLIDYCPCLLSSRLTREYMLYHKVGNGGLSLRKVSACISILKRSPEELLRFYKENARGCYHEDVCWALQSRRIDKTFNIPNWKEAMLFSIETHPGESYSLIHKKLPFGCHAPDKYEPEFWANFIPAKLCTT
jgi:hypothetical protein